MTDDAERVLTTAEIAAGLREIGVRAGMQLMVHSSLSRFGFVEGGARAVIDALMEVITPQGTLLMPSFNHGAAFEEGAPGFYDPSETPTTNGAIPDLFWRLPGVSRSLNPTHPFAAWGRDHQSLTQFHHRTLTMGPESPLGRLCSAGGYGLLLGVGYGSNTFHHVVEMFTNAPCLGQRSEAYPVRLPDGRTVLGRTWGWRASACPIDDYARYQTEMEARALHRVGMIAKSRITLFRLQDCYEVIAHLLQNGLNEFLPCSLCKIRPEVNPFTTPSDWDASNQRLLDDSAAWTY